MRRTFLAGGDLVDKAVQLATDIDPWAERITCSAVDYVAAGLGGNYHRIPIPRPLTATVSDFKRFTHPLSPERLREYADDFRRDTHIVDLVVSDDVPPGEIRRD